MTRTILFVDDEPNILQGLQRLLRPMRGKWDMHFAPGGRQALELMETIRFDAVVSDMRMPGMDGPELLHKVMQLYPEVVRFALSGYSDQEMVGRSIAPTHQYLTKPCEAETLITALEQAMSAKDLVANPDILTKISRIEHLPALPEAYRRITAELAKGDPSPRVVGDIMGRDVGLTADLLKLVNSAYFGLSRQITDPHHAVIILGVDLIRSLTLSLHVFQSFAKSGDQSFSMELLWSHCLRASASARAIAQVEGLPKAQADMACTAALLHDVGKLLLDISCHDECRNIYQTVRTENRRVAEVEAEQLGVTHAQVGAYLLGLWGLPGPVVHAVARHHGPEPDPEPVGPANILYFANILEHEIFVFHEHYARAEPAPERIAAIGGPEKLEHWRQAIIALGLSREEE